MKSSTLLQGIPFFTSILTGAGAVARLAAVNAVDMRYKIVVHNALSWQTISTGILVMALLTFFARRLLQTDFPQGTEIKPLLKCQAPLLFWVPFWFIRPDFSGLLLIITGGAASCGMLFFFHKNYHWHPTEQQRRIVVWTTALLAAAGGWYMQCYVLDKMIMQWLDWGHFYEALNNTLDGRFFHLNLVQGCYLSSRFCLSLLILLPVVMLQSPKLFLLTGTLSLASGALFCSTAARKNRFSNSSAIILAIWFITLPITCNLLLPLLDGFHEVFLLLPATLGAWYCYRNGHRNWAAVLVLFTFCTRETVGFMWAGYAVVLLTQKRFRDGLILLAVSIFMLWFLLKFFMPYLSGKSTYDHVVWFPHLGNSIREIVLSPIEKPEVFWGGLFKTGNWYFWISLLLPFIWAIWKKPLLLLPMLPDLIMVSLDNRIDSQNLLRHYQMTPYIVLIIAALEGLFAIRRNKKTRKYCNAITGAMLGASVLSCWCFTQIPGFPASDSRMLQWSRADNVMKNFVRHLPEGAKVSAGARIAAQLVGRNDIYLCDDFGHPDEPLKEYVFIESFNSGRESRLRKELLTSPEWQLLHQEYLDERLLQLFKNTPGKKQPERVQTVRSCSDADWEKFGFSIPASGKTVSLRGTFTPGHTLLIGARLKKSVSFDIGFSTEICYQNEDKVNFFTSFGDGAHPAYLSRRGDYYMFEIKLDGQPKQCKVDIVVLK